MVDSPHSTLTGADLHEPKGIASADAGDVYVADGAGSGTMTPSASLSGAFGNRLLHVQEVQTAGTTAASRTATAWTAHTLNSTATNEITGASLAANTITLPAGTYYIDAWSTHYFSGNASSNYVRMRVYNVSASSTILRGGTFITSNSGASSIVTASPSFVRGRFTIASPSNITVQYYSTQGGAPVGLAAAAETEVYTDVMVWKVA
jgi:hypothetical protein